MGFTKRNLKKYKSKTRKRLNTKNNNFYGYVNSVWFNKIKIKEDRVSINEYNILQDKVDNELINIGKDLRKDKNIDNLYSSYYNFHANKNTVELEIQKMIAYFEVARKDRNNLFKYLGYCSKYRINHPFYWAIQINPKDSTKYSCNIGENGLGLSDIGHYKKKGPYTDIRSQYLKYIKKSFDLLLGDNHRCKAEDVLKIETYLALFTNTDVENRDTKKTYNVYSPSALNRLGFNVQMFLKKIGYEKIPTEIILNNPIYTKVICKYLKNWNNDFFYSYWVFKIFNSFARYHEEWRKHEFEFYEHYLMGQNKIISPEKFAFKHGISIILNTELTNRYMKKHGNTQNIEYCHELFKKIRCVFRKRLEHNCWLSLETKKLALKKLDSMVLHCGLKKRFINDPKINFKEDNPIYNYFEYRKWYINNQIHLNFKEVNTNIWDRFDSENVFDVNAYYFPLMNQIIIPNAILQSPFINNKRSMTYNLAYIGTTIGHEMIHAFDDEGSQYDHNGNLKNWWIEVDKKEYMKKQKSVVSQYENYAKKIDHFKLNGRFSLGENIADIGGLAIAEETLLDYLREENYTEEKIDEELKKFYIYYCEQWRTKIKTQAKHELSATDEHVNPKYRANMSLARCKNYLRLFNVKKGDLMYWYDGDQIW